jgi:fimbrial isopeptide formation D2 family protein/LPXTG-motif cell wall-anchored protein
MSKRKKLTSLLAAGLAAGLTGAMAALMVPSAQAAPEPPATSDLMIHKYIGTALAGAMADGTEQDLSQQTGLTPVNGVAFDLYRVGAAVNPAPPAEPWPDRPPVGSYAKDSATGHLMVYSGLSLIGEYDLTSAAPAQITTGPNGTGTASSLSQGLYLVMENVAASTSITNANTGAAMFVSQAAAPFIVALPMINPDGDAWLNPVHVYPKNEALSVEKTVDTTGGVMVGDTVSYAITTSVPSDIATSQRFDIVDRLDAALDVDINSVSVSVLPALSLAKDTDYTVNYDAGLRELRVSLTDTGRAKLSGATSLVVSFDSTVNASILSAPDLTVPNTGQVDFTNSDGTEFSAVSDPGDGGSAIHTASIVVTTVDSSGQALNGAAFKIASSQANAEAGHFLRQDPVTQALYDYDASPTSAWAQAGSANDLEIMPTNKASFLGLRDFIDNAGVRDWQTYWVVETATPASYNRLIDPIQVSFEDAFTAVKDPAEYTYTYELTVTYSQAFILPETGGTGTVLWTIGGTVLVGLAVLLAATKRKKTSVG